MCSISDQIRHHLWETLNLVTRCANGVILSLLFFSDFDISLSTMSVCVIWLFWLLCRAALLELPSLLVGKRSHVFWPLPFPQPQETTPCQKRRWRGRGLFNKNKKLNPKYSLKIHQQKFKDDATPRFVLFNWLIYQFLPTILGADDTFVYFQLL